MINLRYLLSRPASLFVVALGVGAMPSACGGSTKELGPSEGVEQEGTGGGSELSSGGSGTIISGTGGGGSEEGGAAGGPSGPCVQPMVAGPCLAFFYRFGFDPETGLCTEFVYGGCDGNENNFETLSACDAVCRDGEPSPVDRCESDTSCSLAPVGCCAPCGEAKPDDYIAINSKYSQTLDRQNNCGEVSCVECVPADTSHLGVKCQEHRCVVVEK